MGRRLKPTGDPAIDATIGLTLRERAFVDELASQRHGTIQAAALAAGYAPETARSNSHQWLQRPRIQAALSAALVQHGYTIDRAAEDLVDVALHAQRLHLDVQGNEHWAPDNMAKIKGHELIGKLTGAISSTPTIAAPQINISMYGLTRANPPSPSEDAIDVTPS